MFRSSFAVVVNGNSQVDNAAVSINAGKRRKVCKKSFSFTRNAAAAIGAEQWKRDKNTHNDC